MRPARDSKSDADKSRESRDSTERLREWGRRCHSPHWTVVSATPHQNLSLVSLR